MEKKTIKQRVAEVMKETKTNEVYPQLTGQQCGTPTPKIVITNDIIDVTIEVAKYRSKLKNYELGLQLMELAIMDGIN